MRQLAASPPGVFARQGTNRSHPVRIPSLIGIQDLKYLDSTGLVRHRSIADLMRYSIINVGPDTLAYYGDFQPSPAPTVFTAEEGTGYSDEQLYAMALYLYALSPPQNPNPTDERALHGNRSSSNRAALDVIPHRLYTNNKLTPAAGFTIPEDLRKTEDIINISVGTILPSR